MFPWFFISIMITISYDGIFDNDDNEAIFVELSYLCSENVSEQKVSLGLGVANLVTTILNISLVNICHKHWHTNVQNLKLEGLLSGAYRNAFLGNLEGCVDVTKPDPKHENVRQCTLGKL